MLDSKTNKVFFSAQLTQTYRKCKKPIIDALKKNGIEIGSDIRQTKDIWARDYMPIQVGDNKFMRFRYNPDYLVKVQGMSEFITDKPECNFLRDKDVIDCDVILDGGNVVSSAFPAISLPHRDSYVPLFTRLLLHKKKQR